MRILPRPDQAFPVKADQILPARQPEGLAHQRLISWRAELYQRPLHRLFLRRAGGRLDYQLIYLYRGAGHFFLQDSWVDLTAGNLILYRPYEPQIYSFYDKCWDKVKMVPGLVFTIEPIINTGRPDCKIDADGWTARTVDGGLSAQWEHTIGITEDGAIIFTEKMV